MLIAFVAISLVVSSIMIGVIIFKEKVSGFLWTAIAFITLSSILLTFGGADSLWPMAVSKVLTVMQPEQSAPAVSRILSSPQGFMTMSYFRPIWTRASVIES